MLPKKISHLVWTALLRKKFQVNLCKERLLPHLFRGFCTIFEEKISFKVNQENVKKNFKGVAP